MDQKDLSADRSVTLNSLRDEQYALNRRMLLAIQNRDLAAQEDLRAELEDVARRIDQLLSGGTRRQVFPQ